MNSGVNEAAKFNCFRSSLHCSLNYLFLHSSNLPKRDGFGLVASKIGLGSVHSFSAASKLTVGLLLALRSAVAKDAASLQVIL